MVRQALGVGSDVGVKIDRCRVHELAGLLAHRLDDSRMTVPYGNGGHAGDAVQVSFSASI